MIRLKFKFDKRVLSAKLKLRPRIDVTHTSQKRLISSQQELTRKKLLV